MLTRTKRIGAFAAMTMLLAVTPALAQKQGGTLRMYIWDNPPSASIHEEATVSTTTPFMGLFNNLVLYDQHEKLNSMDNIRPELATSWAWNDDKTRLTFKLREGVKWHDGKPFTAKDVVCTLDKLQDKATDKFRKNPRAIWFHNLKEVTANGDHEVTFQLNRPQASFLALFATGYNPVYPCHVSAAEMRTKPVGTGPFKFVEFKSNESVKVVRNPDYWRKGHPYLDGIDWRVISNRSTRALAFVAGEFDMTFSLDLTVAITKDIQSQLPKAICELQPTNNSFNLIVNREVAPFNDPKIRSALALALDRKAFVDIITDGKGKIGGVMLAGPEGLWGMPPDVVATLPGYGADVAKSRAEARKIMEGLGYGPGNPLKIKVGDAQYPALSRPRGAADRPAEADPRRGRARRHRHQRVVRQGRARGVHGRHEPDGRGPRRPRRRSLRELRVRLGAQLHQVLQSGCGEADRGAVARDRSCQAPEAGLGCRDEACRGCCAADYHAGRRRPMLAAVREELRAASQQPL